MVFHESADDPVRIEYNGYVYSNIIVEIPHVDIDEYFVEKIEME